MATYINPIFQLCGHEIDFMVQTSAFMVFEDSDVSRYVLHLGLVFLKTIWIILPQHLSWCLTAVGGRSKGWEEGGRMFE